MRKKILDMLVALHIGTKILGLSPYSRTENGYCESKIGSVMVVCILIFHLLNSVFMMIDFRGGWPNLIIQITTEIKIYISILSTVNIYFNEIRNQKHFQETIKTLDEIDTVIENFGVKIPYEKTKIIIAMTIGVVYTFFMITCILDYVALWRELTIYWILFPLIFIIPNVTHAAMSCIFCTYIGIITQRIKIINDVILKNLMKTIKRRRVNCFYIEKNISFYQRNGDAKIIQELKLSHRKLCVLIKRFNSMYSIQILTTITIGYSVTFIQFHYWFSTLRHHLFNVFKPLTLAHSSTVFCFNVLPVIIIIICSENCTSEIKKTAIILLRISTASKNSFTVKAAKQFILQLSCISNCISAAGFFDVGLTLLATMIGSAVTYLVILIQFDIALT